MDPTARYFGKLRSLAVTLETETAHLQQVYQNYAEDNNDDNIVDGGARVLHELHSEIKGIKGQVQDQLVQRRANEQEVRSFMEACMVMKQRFTADVDRVRRYCEQYGYQAPVTTGNPLEVKVGEGEDLPHVTPLKMPPPSSPDPMRTPQFSDFGLSEMYLRNVMGVAELTSDVAPSQTLSFSSPSLYASLQPPRPPKTPKCALLMSEEEEPMTPHLSEYTMCLDNDFTMALCRKEDKKTHSPTASVLPDLPPHSLTTAPYCLATNDSMQSPEPPVLFNPGFNLTKTNAQSPSTMPMIDSLGYPGHLGSLQTTPESPVLHPPRHYRLLGTKKDAGERDVAADTQESNDAPFPGPSSPSSRDARRPWECYFPELRTPKTPNLDFFFGSDRLPTGVVGDTGALSGHNPGAGEPSVPALDLDGPTEEFNLGTPRVRGDYREPSTSDLGSVTLEITRLVSKTPLNARTERHHLGSPGKENGVQCLSVISESEFLSLPSYMRQVSWNSLNQAVQKINSTAARQHHGQQADYLMKDLKRIAELGTKAPIYFLCLKELKRLEHVEGVGNNAVYRLLSNYGWGLKASRLNPDPFKS